MRMLLSIVIGFYIGMSSRALWACCPRARNFWMAFAVVALVCAITLSQMARS